MAKMWVSSLLDTTTTTTTIPLATHSFCILAHTHTQLVLVDATTFARTAAAAAAAKSIRSWKEVSFFKKSSNGTGCIWFWCCKINFANFLFQRNPERKFWKCLQILNRTHTTVMVAHQLLWPLWLSPNFSRLLTLIIWSHASRRVVRFLQPFEYFWLPVMRQFY